MSDKISQQSSLFGGRSSSGLFGGPPPGAAPTFGGFPPAFSGFGVPRDPFWTTPEPRLSDLHMLEKRVTKLELQIDDGAAVAVPPRFDDTKFGRVRVKTRGEKIAFASANWDVALPLDGRTPVGNFFAREYLDLETRPGVPCVACFAHTTTGSRMEVLVGAFSETDPHLSYTVFQGAPYGVKAPVIIHPGRQMF